MSQPKKKTIRLFIFQTFDPWCDIWINFDIRKGKKKYLAPMFASKLNLRCEIAWLEWRIREKKHIYDGIEGRLQDFKDILAALDAGSYYVIDKETQGDLPNIWINEDYLTRPIIEQVITYYLQDKGYLKSRPRYQWNKPELICQDV